MKHMNTLQELKSKFLDHLYQETVKELEEFDPVKKSIIKSLLERNFKKLISPDSRESDAYMATGQSFAASDHSDG